MALTKADLAENLFNELGLNKREAKEFVEIFFDRIRGALADGEQVKLSGFGNFSLRQKNSHYRPARRHLPRQPQTQGTSRAERQCEP
jgi:integration host factor subunit alpha